MKEGGPISWLARPPDLTSCDFCSCDYVTAEQFFECSGTNAEVEAKLLEVISLIGNSILQNVLRNIKVRFGFVF